MAYNILSLDGGGSWALIEVKVLQQLFGERACGHDVLSKFDLVTGNSGGSIVLAALAANRSLDEVLLLFKDETVRRSMFSPYWSIFTPFYRLFGLGPKYATAEKIAALNRLLPEIAGIDLSDVREKINGKFGKKPHFLIPAFDYNLQRVNFFRSDRNSNGSAAVLAGALGKQAYEPLTDHVSINEAAHASSTAPVNFFNETAFVPGASAYFWDGAVAGYNNPVLAAVIEAMVNGQAPRDLVVFSAGSGGMALPAGHGQTFDSEILRLKISAKEGLKNDVKKMAQSILSGPPDAASYVAQTVMYSGIPGAGLSSRFIRANPQLQPVLAGNNWQLPKGLTLNEFKSLKCLDMDAIEQEQVALIEKFCDLWLEGSVPNQPVRAGRNLECLLGQPDFKTVLELAALNGLTG